MRVRAVGVALVAVGCLLSAGTPAQAGQKGHRPLPASGPHEFDLEAHRGGIGLTTENTLEAFQKAMALGVTTLELDVQITEDHQAVVTHDRRVSAQKCRDTAPVAPGDPEYPYVGDYIKSLTLAQVWTLDCGQGLADFPGQQIVPRARMPLLRQVFALVNCYQGNRTWLNVETKVEAGAPQETAPREEFVQITADEIRRAGLLDRVTIQSFDWGALMRMRQVEPRLPIVALTNGDFLQVGKPGASPWLGGIDVDDFGGSYVRAADSFGADALSPVHGNPQNGKVTDPGYQPYTTRRLVREAHARGMAVVPWTVDDKPTMASLMDAGVDGLITNYPDRLRELMAERRLKLPRPAHEPRGRDCLAEASGDGRPAPGRDLTVTTYNIHHAEGVDGRLDLERIAREIAATRPDVVGLQEVDRHWGERSEFADQATRLARRLDMAVVYAANLDLDPLQPGQPRRQYGTAILSRFAIVSSRNTLLPRPEGGEQRGLLEAVIAVRGVRVRVANTHLQHNSAVERTAQVARIMELLEDAKEPTVLVGDLNAVAGATELAPLFTRFDDAWTIGGQGDGFTIPAEAADRRIDYVLVSPEVEVQAATVRPTLASDHLPVTARLSVPREARELARADFSASREGPVSRVLELPSRMPARVRTGMWAGVAHDIPLDLLVHKAVDVRMRRHDRFLGMGGARRSRDGEQPRDDCEGRERARDFDAGHVAFPSGLECLSAGMTPGPLRRLAA